MEPLLIEEHVTVSDAVENLIQQQKYVHDHLNAFLSDASFAFDWPTEDDFVAWCKEHAGEVHDLHLVTMNESAWDRVISVGKEPSIESVMSTVNCTICLVAEKYGNTTHLSCGYVTDDDRSMPDRLRRKAMFNLENWLSQNYYMRVFNTRVKAEQYCRLVLDFYKTGPCSTVLMAMLENSKNLDRIFDDIFGDCDENDY